MQANSAVLSADEIDALIAFRQALHQHPELSGEEIRTAEAVVRFVRQFHPDEIITGLGGQGVAAIFNGAQKGLTVMVRAELDGLPITEQSDKPYTSQNPGKGHLCGHDGHMAILMGLAAMISRNRPKSGRLILLFQPAEETGEGARAILDDPQFARIKPDYVFALHNYPGLKRGAVLLGSGTVNCASRGMKISLKGRTSHASIPEDGISPAPAIADIITKARTLTSPVQDILDESFRQATLVHARIGEPAFGIAPGAGEVWLTLRTVTDEAMDALVDKAEKLVEEAMKDHGLVASISYHDIFHACRNDDSAVFLLEAALQAEKTDYRPLDTPMRWSEDFGRYGAKARAAMFFLGAGEQQPQLHNPDYDFPDALIDPAARIFYQAVQQIVGTGIGRAHS